MGHAGNAPAAELGRAGDRGDVPCALRRARRACYGEVAGWRCVAIWQQCSRQRHVDPMSSDASPMTPRSRPRLNPDCYKFIVSMLSTPDVLTFKAVSTAVRTLCDEALSDNTIKAAAPASGRAIALARQGPAAGMHPIGHLRLPGINKITNRRRRRRHDKAHNSHCDQRRTRLAGRPSS